MVKHMAGPCRLSAARWLAGTGVVAALAVAGCGSTTSTTTSTVGAGAVSVVVVAPTSGSVIAASNVTVRGTVDPANATVQIQGQPAAVGNGVFTGTAALHPGKTTIDVIGSAPGMTPGSTSLTITQQSSGSPGGSSHQGSSSGGSATPGVAAERGDSAGVLRKAARVRAHVAGACRWVLTRLASSRKPFSPRIKAAVAQAPSRPTVPLRTKDYEMTCVTGATGHMHRRHRRLCLLLPLTGGRYLRCLTHAVAPPRTHRAERAGSVQQDRVPRRRLIACLSVGVLVLCVAGLVLFVFPTTRHVKVVRVLKTDQVGPQITSTPSLPAASAGVQPGRKPVYEEEPGAPSVLPPPRAALRAPGCPFRPPFRCHRLLRPAQCHTSRPCRACRWSHWAPDQGKSSATTKPRTAGAPRRCRCSSRFSAPGDQEA